MVAVDLQTTFTPTDGARPDAGCAHCGLDVPRALLAETGPSFCCAGCQTVHDAILAGGLARYYSLVEGERGQVAATTSGRSYQDFDDPAFLAGFARETPGGRRCVDLYLDGVTCAACVWLVERAGQLVDGSVEVRLDVASGVAEVGWDPTRTQLSAIAGRLDSLGHPAHALEGAARDARRQEERALLARIGVAWAVAGNVMVMALAMYAGAFEDMQLDETRLFRQVSLVLVLPSFFWAGNVFLKGAWAALRARVLHMDLPIAIGLTAGFIGGAVNTIRGQGEVYFDSVASLIFLLLVGRWLQLRQRRVASDAASLLFSLAPRIARRVDADGQIRDIPIETVLAGDVLELRAGDTVPADGTIVHGATSIDAAILTGEPRPIDVGEGDAVHAGMVNISAAVRMRADRTGAATRVGRLLMAMTDAARRRAPVVLLADRVVGWFVATVLLLALATAVLWSQLDPAAALDHVVALLVVTCPCALGLATPLAVQAAVGQAARHGIFVKGGDAIERLARPMPIGQPGELWFDKTGTLTQGRMRMQAWHGDETVQPLVHALESSSAHPLAQALLAALPGAGLLAEGVVQTPGGGIAGHVAGHHIIVGAPAFVLQQVGASSFATEVLTALLAETLTPVLIARDGVVVAAAGLGDPIREDAAQSVKALQQLGFRVGILSGDHPDVVAAVGRSLGIAADRALGGQTPEAKLAVIREASARGPVLMVGDGVNDAAALAAATVGISVHGGAEASLAAADVFLTRPGLQAVVEVVVGARETMRVIRRNLMFSLGYNVIGASLAIAGLLSPLVAALLMPVSSLTVVTSSWRTRWFRPTTAIGKEN